jgi:hypothetical protein
MKPRVLVLYYSQTGQLKELIDSILSGVKDQLDITYAAIEPVTPWPFPWKANTFFDAMPECVVQEPSPVKPLPQNITQQDYDLVILGWQPWFLHPSQPITAFLQSRDAAMLKDKPVLTVVGCRNMWLNAGERIKEGLMKAGAHQVGNIVLADTNTNLVSLLTIIRWVFSGRKEASRWLPAAGVQDADIKGAVRFGKPIQEAAQAIANSKHKLQTPAVASLHQRLLELGAVNLDTGLVLLEQRGIKNFRFWAKFIRAKGGPGAAARQGRVTMFKRLLITAVFVLSPLSSLTAFIQRKLQQKRLLGDVTYFKGVSYEPGRI